MIKYFENLREEDAQIMYKVPVYVTILLAGADDKIDKKELQEAISIANLKKIKARKLLVDYFAEVVDTFEEDLYKEIDVMPDSAEERNPILVEKLERVNIIFHYLDSSFAIQFYESMKDWANKIATASGGVLGFLSVGHEESKYVDLRMIRNPVRLKKKK